MARITYFPFTCLAPGVSRTLAAFFSNVSLFSFERLPQADAIRLTPAFLPEDQAKGLAAREKDYLSWAQLHKGNEKNLKHLLKADPYFTSDTDLTAIQSQIRSLTQSGVGSGFGSGAVAKGGGTAPEGLVEGQGQTAGGKDPLLFLKLADHFDRETSAIDQELLNLDKSKQAFLDELKGELGEETELAGAGVLKGSDPGLTMPGERISAWAAAARQAGLLDDDPLILVTTSAGIMDHILTNTERARNGLDINPIKVHEDGCADKAGGLQDIEKILDQIVAGTPLKGETSRETDLTGVAPCCGLSGQIKVCLLEGDEVNQIFKIPGRTMAVCLVQLNS